MGVGVSNSLEKTHYVTLEWPLTLMSRDCPKRVMTILIKIALLSDYVFSF